MIDIKTLNIEKIKELFNDEKYRKYIITGGTSALIILYLLLFILPGISRLIRTSMEKRELTDKIELMDTSIQRLGKKTIQLIALRKETAGYAEGFPDKKDIPQFLEQISATAKKSGIRILSITPSALSPLSVRGKPSPFYSEMPLTITARSGYHQLGQFIGRIESSKRFITIESLKIRNDKQFPRKHNVGLVLKAYVSMDGADDKK